MMLLPTVTDSAYKTSILTKKTFYPHFNVQNMAKKGNLKSALYLESPEFLKIC